MNCQSLAVQASLLQKVRGYGGEVYYSNKTNKGLPRSCLSTCKYRAFEMNISEDRGMVLGGSSSPSGWELGVKCGASLHLPPQHHLCSPPATSHLRLPQGSVPSPRNFVRWFCRCEGTTCTNTVLCRMKWLNVSGAQHIHFFSCLKKKGEGISFMPWKSTRVRNWDPLAGSSEPWGGFLPASPLPASWGSFQERHPWGEG